MTAGANDVQPLIVKQFPSPLHERLRIAAIQAHCHPRDLVIEAVRLHLEYLEVAPREAELPLQP
jgi:hypothetical protein